MLLEFTVANFRSFKEAMTLSMVAANLVAKDKTVDEGNLITIDEELKLLKTAAIYGANASGKSNLVKALTFMKLFLVNSSKESQSVDKIGVEPFRLNPDSEVLPSHFELVFIMEGKRYRYGFEAVRDRVTSEWLYYVPSSRETNLFIRKDGAIRTTKKLDAEGLDKRTRSNALYLSVCAQFNVPIAEQILKWVTDKLHVLSGLHDHQYLNYTASSFASEVSRERIISLIKALDVGISDISVEHSTLSIDSLPNAMPDELKKLISRGSDTFTQLLIKTTHKKYRNDGSHMGEEFFDLEENESDGTQKLFALAGPLLNALKEGEILFIDELDARLHPLVSLAIIRLFSGVDTNPRNAQLVFMTHDTNLLDNKLFRRDQLWFTEKNRQGATSLYSLAEYKVRNDASFGPDYIKGKYGAIPFIGTIANKVASLVHD
jgi:AAA15 family ATPase/GTPase